MKRLCFLMALAIATPAVAQEPEAENASCADFGGLAYSIMEARQSGASLSDMLGILELNGIEALRPVVMSAFDVPRFHTEGSMQRAAEDFRELIERECYQITE